MNGSVSEGVRTWIASAATSIAPVDISSFTISAGLARTVPSTATTYSNFSSAAVRSSASGAPSSMTTWVMP